MTNLPIKNAEPAAAAGKDVSRAAQKSAEARPAMTPGSEAAQEHLSTLMAMIMKLIDERGSAIIHLTASRRGEGTTTIAREIANLAAQSKWCKVALLDAARAPKPTGPQAARIMDAVNGDPAELALHPIRLGDADVTAGQLNRAGSFMVKVDTVRKYYSWLRTNFSLVIVDCPAVLSSGEAASLAALADGTILVAEAERAKVADLERARELLLQAGGGIFGVILNKRRTLPDYLSRLI